MSKKRPTAPMLKRISTFGYAAALATAPAWATACSTPAATESQDPSVLFSLSSDAMHFENPSGMNVTLVMDGVDPSTIWFTDRPVRESGAITTGKLAAQWADDGTFTADPPNAALVLHEPTMVDGTETDTLVAEVMGASYDPKAGTFRADLTVLTDEDAHRVEGNLGKHGDRHDHAWPAQAGAVSLFIDSVNLDAVTANTSPSPTAASVTAPATSAPQSPTPQPSGTVPLGPTGARSSAPLVTGTTAAATSGMKVMTPTPGASTTRGTSAAIKLCSSPTSCNNSTTQNITYNSTIYFQVTVSQSPSR